MKSDDFTERQIRYRKLVRDHSLELNSELLEARSLALTFLVSQQIRIQGMSFRASDSRMDRLALYLQGTDLSFSAIVDGLYAQAAALQRQELEQITAMEEELNGKRKDGRVANIQNTWSMFKIEYGSLSDGAHLGAADLVAQLSSYELGGKSGPTTVPQFRQEYCRSMLFNHILYLLHACRHAVTVFADTFGTQPTQEEYETIDRAIELLNTKANRKDSSASA